MVGVLVLVLALGACGSEPTHVADEVDVPAPVDETMLDRASIAEQKDVWTAARPSAYAYEVETECECPRAGTFEVTVEGEEVVEVVPQDPGAEPHRAYPAPTIDEAFAMLDEPLALAADGEIPTGRASALFEPTFGYPTSFSVVGSGGLPSSHVEIRDFTPIDPAALDRPPAQLVVIVTNQSYGDPDVQLTVAVDGEEVIDRSFAVEGQHTYVTYRLRLEPGDHRVVVRADTGDTDDRVVRLGSEPRYLAVAYWGDDSDGGDAIEVEESNEPFGMA